ncbi:uncharacterized protein [Argopecten irradians]|uniref:uncharacterized protein n=1 Tax=Argopecten irradians TaxID=31199 RepID=UPI00371D9ABE
MGKVYCCAASCSNFSGKVKDGRTVSLHRFPANSKISKIWEQRVKCFRKNFNLKPATRLCSEHFEGKSGPSESSQLPSIFPQKVFKTNRVGDNAICTPQVEEFLTDHVDVVGTTENESDFLESERECENSLCLNASFSETYTSVLMHDYGGSISEEHISTSINKEVQTDDVVILTTEEFSRYTLKSDPSVKNTCDAGVQCKLPNIAIEDIKDNDEEVMFYTGFPSFLTFMLAFDTIKSLAENMSYWRGQNSSGEKQYQRKNSKKPGPGRKLRLIDEFLMVFIRLRLGLLEGDLARRFNISVTTCCNIWRTWVQFLDQELVPVLLFWPSKDAVVDNMPAQFKRRYPKTRVILDCTEIRTETPKSTKAKSLLYSNYKSHMTWKVLVGITPAGVASFVSPCYAGSVSDKKITELSKIVDLCEEDDAIMVDKGFLISDLTTPRKIHLIIPPFLSKKRKFSRREVLETRRIANLRIHVERQMSRIKLFRILNGVMPLSSADTASSVFRICTAVTTFYPPLVQG